MDAALQMAEEANPDDAAGRTYIEGRAWTPLVHAYNARALDKGWRVIEDVRKAAIAVRQACSDAAGAHEKRGAVSWRDRSGCT